MRFAFYGRVSTEDQQDPQASKAWQLSRARSLIEPTGGEVVTELFDIGLSRSLPWKRRPEALLDTIKSPGRDFDAVVIGEPQRAFYGSQFGMTFPVFVHYGVELWVPEVGGAVDPGSDAHDLVMALYGGMSKGERNRIKIRVRSAMKAPTELEGRRDGFKLHRSAAGGPQDPEKVSARWRTARTRLRLPENFRLHDWRASKITNDLDAHENPVEVSANARHHSPGYTMARYGRRRAEGAKKLAASSASRIGLSSLV